MTTSEKLVIRDFLKRKRWYYLAGMLMHLAAMIDCWWDQDVVLLGLLPCSALHLLFDLIRGKSSSRTLLSLPVTATQLGKALRFVTFTLPALAAFTILVVTAWIAAAFDAPFLNPAAFLIIAFTQTSMLGALLFLVTGPPLPGSASRLNSVIRNFFMVFWVLVFPAIIGLSRDFPRNLAEIGSARLITAWLMAAATIMAWFGTIRLVQGHSRQPQTAKPFSNKAPATGKALLTPRFGAIPYLIARIGLNMTYITISTIFIFWFVINLFDHNGFRNWSDPINSPWSFIPGALFLLPLFFFFAVQNMVTQLRLLRCVPISRVGLTHLMLFAPLLILLVIGLIVFGIAASNVRGVSSLTALLWLWLLPTMVLSTAFLPFVLRFGFGSWTAPVGMFVLIFLSIMMSDFYRRLVATENPTLYLIPLSAIFLALIWVVTYRLLASPHPWRSSSAK